MLTEMEILGIFGLAILFCIFVYLLKPKPKPKQKYVEPEEWPLDINGGGYYYFDDSDYHENRDIADDPRWVWIGSCSANFRHKEDGPKVAEYFYKLYVVGNCRMVVIDCDPATSTRGAYKHTVWQFRIYPWLETGEHLSIIKQLTAHNQTWWKTTFPQLELDFSKETVSYKPQKTNT